MPPSQFLYNAGRLEEALASYDRAVEIQPDNAAAPQNRVATKQREKLAAREA